MRSLAAVRRAAAAPLMLLVLVATSAAACSTGAGTAPTHVAASAAASGGAVASGGSACPTAQPAALPAGETRTVTIATDLGSIVIRVQADLSPIATGNFVALAGCGFYDGVVFHRVVPGFVIQGGDGKYGRVPNIDAAHIGQGDAGYSIKDEPVTATYRRGVVAMARSSQPDSQGSQFFIVLDDSAVTSLAATNNYAIIGTVTTGMDVADKIAAAAGGVQIPPNPVVMTHVTVTKP